MHLLCYRYTQEAMGINHMARIRKPAGTRDPLTTSSVLPQFNNSQAFLKETLKRDYHCVRPQVQNGESGAMSSLQQTRLPQKNVSLLQAVKN